LGKRNLKLCLKELKKSPPKSAQITDSGSLKKKLPAIYTPKRIQNIPSIHFHVQKCNVSILGRVKNISHYLSGEYYHTLPSRKTSPPGRNRSNPKTPAIGSLKKFQPSTTSLNLAVGKTGFKAFGKK